MDFESLKCVWMSSGVVEYKLCDQNFDCDKCAFDKALWHRPEKPAAGIAPLKDNIIQDIHNSIELDEKRFDCSFISSHFVLRKLYKNTYFIGLTKFFWACLMPISDIKIDIEKGFTAKSFPGIHLSKGKSQWDISFPFNTHLLMSMSDQFNENGILNWLGLFEADENEVDFLTVPAAEYKTYSQKYINELNNFEFSNEVGITLNDGGIPVKSLYHYLGEKQFAVFIEKILKGTD